MNPARRTLLLALAAPGAARAQADDEDRVHAGRMLRFPRDHGAHPGSRIEWWYATGWLGTPAAPVLGFQVTFFRWRHPAEALPGGRFAPRHLLMAHAALTDLGARRHRHAQRMVRWSGDETAPLEHTTRADTRVRLGGWQLQRDPARGAYRAEVADGSAHFGLVLALAPTQPLLLQGQAGHSRKGPREAEASHYYSQPQLATRAEVVQDGRRTADTGRAWLDHEWSHQLLAPEAQGWDWCGINLFNGGALTAFVLRRKGGGAPVWAGGSLRAAGATAATAFAPHEVQWQAQRPWQSPHTGAAYPMQWLLHTPAGRHTLRALLDDQELGARAGDGGTVYWEGLAELLDERGQRVGLGYLEMTGYAAPMKM